MHAAYVFCGVTGLLAGSVARVLDLVSKECWLKLLGWQSLCAESLSKTFYLLLSTGPTQEYPFRHTGQNNTGGNVSGCRYLSHCRIKGPELDPCGRFHTFVEIDHEIISTLIIFPPADSRRVVVSYKQK